MNIRFSLSHPSLPLPGNKEDCQAGAGHQEDRVGRQEDGEARRQHWEVGEYGDFFSTLAIPAIF